ncbi:hypothetical protein [Kocuria flava]|uniref:Lysine transporter LysE n=1 Tax=Kocuria flava TaxID=446860 RepID=A0A2N4T3H9_9MICC|nr:hypothetical protein [Kocuria flava]PLC12777.1 hypothetical protein AUQ48_11785 [Kocuria flava]
MDYPVTLALTAVGGFDPTSALVAIAALGAGVPRRHVVGFVVLLVGGTAGWGVALTVLGGEHLAALDWHALVRGGVVSAWLQLLLGALLGGWALWRARRAPRAGRPRRVRSPAGLYAAAVGYVAIVVLDLSFDVLVRASAAQPLTVVVPGWLVWAVLTQAPLVVLGTAVALDRHTRVATAMSRLWRRLAPAAGTLVTACLGVAGLVLAADGAEFLVRGRFLLG